MRITCIGSGGVKTAGRRGCVAACRPIARHCGTEVEAIEVGHGDHITVRFLDPGI